MARALAICTCEWCGKTFEKVQYCHNRREADNWEEWAERNFTVCPDCWREQKEKERQEANEKAAKENAENGLPTLTGSPKQIAWAEKIRNEMMAYLNGCTPTEEFEAAFNGFKADFAQEASAGKWIDRHFEKEKWLILQRYISAQFDEYLEKHYPDLAKK